MAKKKKTNVDEFNDYLKNEAVSGTTLSDEELKEVEEMLKNAKLPILFTDEDFKLGERELDIRGLSPENYKQLMFRMSAILPAIYNKQVLTTLIDIERLLMLLLTKMGVEDIGKELDDLYIKLAKQNPLN